MQLASALAMLLSVDYEKRREGEEYVMQMISGSFEEGADSLLEVMTQPDPQLAHLAAMIFKTKYIDSKQALAKLPKQKLTNIIGTLRPLINSTKMLAFMKKVCEIIVKVYSHMQGQEELMTLIHTLGTSFAAAEETQSMKQAGLYLIQISCQSAFDDSIRIGHSSQLISVINQGLSDQNRRVQMAAFKAIIAFLTSIEEEKHMKKFSHLLKDILSQGAELVKFDQESGVQALQRLDSLISIHPNFLKSIFQDLLLMFCEIMQTPHLQVNLRKIALNLILTLCSHFKTTSRKSLFFKTHLIPSYMKVMSEIDSVSMEEWSGQLQEEQMSQNMPVLTVKHLCKLTQEVGNKFMFPLFLPLITEALDSQHPQQQLAALSALTVIVEDCDLSFRTKCRALMKQLLALMSSKDPRVISALVIAIGSFTSQFTPGFQIQFGRPMLEFITQTMKHPIAKLQYQAVLFLKNIIVRLQKYPQIIGSFMTTIFGQIYRIYQQSLSTSNFTMMEAALETLSAATAVKGLGSCSTVFIPKLMQAVHGVSANQPKIKKVAIQAVGCVLYSLKDRRELFGSEGSKIMQTMISLQQKIDPKDSLNIAIMSVYKKVVKVMKNKFTVYSDPIFSRAAQSAVIPIDCQMMDQLDQLNKGQPNEGSLTVKVDLKIDGLKQLVADVSSIELKIEATCLLKSMSQHMGPSFLKYSEKMISIISELIRQRRSKKIRHNMVDCCKYLVLACRNPQEKHAILQRVDPHLGGALLAAIGNDERETICLIVKAYSKILKKADCNFFDSLRGKLVAVLATVSRKTKQIKKQYGNRQLDEEQVQQMDEKIEEEQQVLEDIKKIMRLAKGDLVFIALEDLFPYEFVLSEHEEQSEQQEQSESQ